MTIIFQIVNLLLFLAVIVYFTRRPVMEFWTSHVRLTKRDIEEAASLRNEAQKEYNAWDERVRNAGREAEELKDELAREAKIERDMLIKDAKKYAGQLEKEITRFIKQKRRKAWLKLERDAIGHAVDVAARRFKKELGEEDHKKLTKKYMEEIMICAEKPISV